MKKWFLLFGMALVSAISFAQYRIATEGTSKIFVMTDISTSKEESYQREYVKADLNALGNIVIVTAFGASSGRPFEFSRTTGIPYTEFRDGNDSDATFANSAAVITWFRDNTGFKSASGGSEADLPLNVKDYGILGDGTTNDATAINAFFTSVPDGSTIIFTEGQYLIGSVGGVTLSGKSNVTIIGQGATFVSADINYTQIIHGRPLLHILNGSNVTVRGLKFDGTATAGANKVSAIAVTGSSDTKIEKNEVWGMSSNGGVVEGNCDRSVYDGNIVRNSRVGSQSRGMWLGNGNPGEFTRDLTVINNKTYNNDYTGIVFFSDGGKASGNYSYNNLGSGIITGGAVGYKVQNVSIVGNILENNAFYGYQHDSYAGIGSDILSNISVVGNVIIGNTTGGVLLLDCEDTVLSGNLIKGNTGIGVNIPQYLIRGLINGNTIIDNGTDGIRMQNTNTYNKDVSISNNIIDGNGSDGIDIQTIDAGGTLDGIKITYNEIKNNTGYGIFSPNNGTITGLKINNNEFEGNGTRDVRLTGVTSNTTVLFENNQWDGDRTQFDLVDDVYDTDWNADLSYATKNAIYDKIQTVGNVTKVSTPVNNQIGIWTGDGTLKGITNFTHDATTLRYGIGTVTGISSITRNASDYYMWATAPSTTGNYKGLLGIGEGSTVLNAGILAYDDGVSGALGMSFVTGNGSNLFESIKINSTGQVTIPVKLFYSPPVIAVTSSRNIASTDINSTLACTTTATLTITSSFSAMNVGQTINLEAHGTTFTILGGAGATVNGVSTGSKAIGNGTDYVGGILRKTGTDTYVVF